MSAGVGIIGGSVAVFVPHHVAQPRAAFLAVGKAFQLAFFPTQALGAGFFPIEIGVIAKRQERPSKKNPSTLL